jgi:CheY-like chemotaxis protein
LLVQASGTQFELQSGMTHTALVVDANPEKLARTVRLLSGAGYVVSPAVTFAGARRLVAALRPDVLVTAIRLDGFNGLHLVVASRAALPDLVAVVTHGAPDPVLQADASTHGALYLSAPIDPALFLDVIAKSLEARGPRGRKRPPRRWPRKRVASRVEAALGDRRGIVVDISYGGAQLQLADAPSKADRERAYDLAWFGAEDLPVRARPVWRRAAGPNGPWWCGVELDAPSVASERAWQTFVDAVR